jgi:hypothetical protein
LSFVVAAGMLALVAPPPAGAAVVDDAQASHTDRYRAGQRALADERWSDALQAFSAIAADKGPESAAALYWKAWTQSKLDRRADALSTLGTLQSAYPKSDWIDDARALEIQLRGPRATVVSTGSGGSAESDLSGDEDLQLYALDSLMQAEPERAVPILERFLGAGHSLKLKKRALFVLSQSESPRAREILLDVARNGEPSELRVEAVRDLGIAGGEEDLAALSRIWKEASPEVKGAVLEAWLIADQTEPILDAARSEPDPELRGKAIDELGAMEASKELKALYGAEKDPELRGKILGALGVAEDVATLAEVARSDADPELRGQAIEAIGVAGGPEAAKQLAALYSAESDPEVRARVLNAYLILGDAHALVALFRREKDPELKRQIVQTLSFIDDPESQAFLEELLGGQS